MRYFRYYWPVITWAILILLLTGLPGNYFPKVPSIWDLLEPDKVVHLFIFIIFTNLLGYGFINNYPPGLPKVFYALIIMASGIAFGGITELLQAYIFVWREASIYDFIADCAGSVSGYLIFDNLISKYLNKS
jgi:VanZ family protein